VEQPRLSLSCASTTAAATCPGLQKRYAGADTAWLVVNSTHAGHPEHMEPAALREHLKASGAQPTAYLLDADGGRARRSVPHHAAAVRDRPGRARRVRRRHRQHPLGQRRRHPKARNHVAAALDELRAGKPVSVATAPAYGCGVKYSPD
jgi:hypothetical protein